MSKKLGVFICPSCQSVVQSDVLLEEGVICGECLHEFSLPKTEGVIAPKGKPKRLTGTGSVSSEKTSAKNEKKPLPKSPIIRDATSLRKSKTPKQVEVERVKVPVKSLEEAVEEELNFSKDEETILADGSRQVKRRKKRPKEEKNLNLILFLSGWIAVIAIIFGLSKLVEDDEKSGEDKRDRDKESVTENTVKKEILRRFYPQVTASFKAFIGHPNNEGRSQYIYNSSDLALAFTKHYQLNPFTVPRSLIKVRAANVIKLSEKDFGIETIWEDREGNRLGALHLWDGEGWKLDWENYAPYSSESWALFRSQLGKKEGQFRLLVRKREVEDGDEKFSLSFYRPPALYEGAEEFRVSESPKVEVATKSELGQRFLKLWEDHKAGDVPYGSVLGELLDPAKYLRVNVELAWEENDLGESVMVLKDILGVLWFGEKVQNHYQETLATDKEEAERGLGSE